MLVVLCCVKFGFGFGFGCGCGCGKIFFISSRKNLGNGSVLAGEILCGTVVSKWVSEVWCFFQN